MPRIKVLYCPICECVMDRTGSGRHIESMHTLYESKRRFKNPQPGEHRIGILFNEDLRVHVQRDAFNEYIRRPEVKSKNPIWVIPMLSWRIPEALRKAGYRAIEDFKYDRDIISRSNILLIIKHDGRRTKAFGELPITQITTLGEIRTIE
jgi:hypothetical protein